MNVGAPISVQIEYFWCKSFPEQSSLLYNSLSLTLIQMLFSKKKIEVGCMLIFFKTGWWIMFSWMAGTREDFFKTVFLEHFFASHKLNQVMLFKNYSSNIICMVKVTVETLWPPRHHIIKKKSKTILIKNILALMRLARFLSQKCKKEPIVL